MAGILRTKLHRPSAPSPLVKRPHLSRLLTTGVTTGRILTLVSAPAGFGKTVCVSQWLEDFDGSVSWLSLDAADDNPGRFFLYLIAALQQIDPNIGHAVAGILQSGQIPPMDILSTTLINDLVELEHAFVLVLDDFQIVQDPFILEMWEIMFANWPPAMHLVLITREDPPLPIARLRASNHLTEIRAADLRFDRPAIEQFLSEHALTEAEVIALEAKTEGWVAGLQLVALALETDPRLIDTLGGSHRFILSYLTEEVLAHQPDTIRRFLLETAILDQLTADLCDAVTERTDSQHILDHLRKANLFLLPLDSAQHWFRYHHLFADLLRDQQPTGRQERHRRASHWFEEKGMITEAIEHALQGEDYSTVVSLLEQHGLDLLMQWHNKTVDAWIEAIPAEWQTQSLRANLVFAWIHMLRGDPLRVMPLVSRLQTMFAAAPPVNETLQAKWLALQAMLANGQDQPQAGLDLAQQALSLTPPGDSQLVSLIYLCMAGAYQQMDDYNQAVETYQRMIEQGHITGNSIAELLGSSALGLLALNHGKLHFAFEVASQSLKRIERTGSLPPVTTALYGELGEIHYQWHQLEQAHIYFQRSIQVSVLSGFNDAELYHRVILSRLFQIRGDLEASAQEIERAMARMQVQSPTSVREEVLVQAVRIRLALGRLAEAEATLQAAGFLPQGAFALPIVETISWRSGLLAISALRIALYRITQRDEKRLLQPSIDLASQLMAAFEQRGYLPLIADTLLIRAQLVSALGDLEAHRQDILTALQLAEPEGAISLFVEAGGPVYDALTRLQSDVDPLLAPFVQGILAAFAEHRREPERTKLLSEREADVLHLMADGLTYQEIGDRLFISLNTVRSHVKAIYGKLHVNNRTKALEQAHLRGLL